MVNKGDPQVLRKPCAVGGELHLMDRGGRGNTRQWGIGRNAMAHHPSQGEFALILVTTNSPEEGLNISRALVESRLAACVNIISGLRSFYRWKGKVWDEGELLLVVKTRMTLLRQLEDKIREMHSYEVPEIISIPIAWGSEPYLDWLRKSTSA